MSEQYQPPLEIAVEAAEQPDVDRLLQLSDAAAARLYPGEYRKPITRRSLDRPGTYVVIARLGVQAVGCVVLFDLGQGQAEVKRLIVDPRQARKGIGRRLMQECLKLAHSQAQETLLLEVGTRNIEARAVYESLGFCPFGPYRETQVATFMRCDLCAESGASSPS
ncbi:GNAT family N-acetyltransferase [Peteryoungia ipomoeae]|uniref:GNAT family N-acetyltransferase n=1 Tax=Peteryoungia ipomoeae TaxID=1210932 RepID=A0A4V4HMP6_9HYPH|nr:GNAT family N-acetyltransferase [Peteryoungia ipomoeae]THV23026.1 GNAT family N-acetyltransferase [Peteryoungia ipomoeae]